MRQARSVAWRSAAGVTPGVVVDHGIRRRQVEPAAPSLEAEEEQGHLLRLEAVDRQGAATSSADELEEITDLTQPPTHQLVLDQGEHADELVENQPRCFLASAGFASLCGFFPKEILIRMRFGFCHFFHVLLLKIIFMLDFVSAFPTPDRS
jgi:hypothetical protein